MPNKKIPHFSSDQEAAEFWDTHDFTDYIADAEPTDELRFRHPALKQISLRLASTHIQGLKRIAAEKGIGYQTLLRMWIAERLQQEKAA